LDIDELQKNPQSIQPIMKFIQYCALWPFKHEDINLTGFRIYDYHLWQDIIAIETKTEKKIMQTVYDHYDKRQLPYYKFIDIE